MSSPNQTFLEYLLGWGKASDILKSLEEKLQFLLWEELISVGETSFFRTGIHLFIYLKIF